MRSKIQSVFGYISEKPFSQYFRQLDKMGQCDEGRMNRVIGILAEEIEELKQNSK